MKSLLLPAIILSMFVITSCDISGNRVEGNGKLTSVTRPIEQTNKIRVEGSLDVFVVPGEPAVRIEADENLVPYIETNLENGWLEIKTRDDINIKSRNSIKIYVTTDKLSALKIDGSGNITCVKKLNADRKLDLSVEGSGDIVAEINAPEVNAEIEGSGNIAASGEAKNIKVDINGSGNYNGLELKAENAKINISGSGDAAVFAEFNLKAAISGSGDLTYKGNATIEKSIAGSGTVVKAE